MIQIAILNLLLMKFFVLTREFFFWLLQTCSCRPSIFVHGRNDESTIIFDASFSIFGPLKRSWRHNSGRSRSLESLQIMFKQCSTSRVLKSWIWITKKYSTFVITSIDENCRTTWTSLTSHLSELESCDIPHLFCWSALISKM